MTDGYRRGDRVRLVGVVHTYEYVKDPANTRRPRVGDVAVVARVHGDPAAGYELVCKDGRGKLQWRLSFKLNDIDLEPA